jgi:hypothetical protein
MEISKAYIIRTTHPLSVEYARDAAKSCENLGISWEYFEGTEQKSSYDAWTQSGVDIKPGCQDHKRDNITHNSASCATVSHARLWKKIYDAQECAIILEHDSLMLHNIPLDIPDNVIVALGYKLEKPERYNHIKAGPPKTIHVPIKGHQGAHAYCITWKTAKLLLAELYDVGVQGVIDNIYFMKGRKTKIPLGIMDPTPAIGWIRKSTIWETSDDVNWTLIRTFHSNLSRL